MRSVYQAHQKNRRKRLAEASPLRSATQIVSSTDSYPEGLGNGYDFMKSPEVPATSPEVLAAPAESLVSPTQVVISQALHPPASLVEPAGGTDEPASSKEPMNTALTLATQTQLPTATQSQQVETLKPDHPDPKQNAYADGSYWK